jgi:hypothetical protein
MKLHHYEDFLERVETLGFLFLTDALPGFPSVLNETGADQWHTGETETDPWQWKDRAAAEKKLAFGCLLGGHKGFIAPWLHADFMRVCQPAGALEERWHEGALRPAVWDLWQQFEQRPILGSNDLSAWWKGMDHKGNAGLDTAIRELQREFFVTVAGNRQKRNRLGEPYGWPHLLYERVDTWRPTTWPAVAETEPNMAAARARILDAGKKAAPDVSARALAKVLRLPETSPR